MRSRGLVCAGLVLGWGLVTGFVVTAARLGRIGTDVTAFQLAYGAGFVGYGLLVWLVTRAVDQRHLGSWRWWMTGCVILHGLLISTKPTDDANRYVWEGRVQLAGFNPYLHAPNDPALTDLRDGTWETINHPDYPAIYGPVAQAEFLGVAKWYSCGLAAKGLHSLWNVFAIGLLAAALRRKGLRPHGAAMYALCPLVLSAFAFEGHVDSLMIMFVTLAAWAFAAERPMVVGVALGLAMATKVVAVVLLPWLLIRHPRSASVAGLVLVACYGPYLGAGTHLVSSLSRFGSGNEFFSLLGALSLMPFDSAAGGGAVVLVLFATLAALAWRYRDFNRHAGAAFEALLILMPVVHYWYLTWVLVLAPFRLRLRWVAAAAAMGVYFESERIGSGTGTWAMPAWAPPVVWSAFAIVALGELVLGWSRYAHTRQTVSGDS